MLTFYAFTIPAIKTYSTLRYRGLIISKLIFILIIDFEAEKHWMLYWISFTLFINLN
jgi:hypothetical protein